MTITREYTVNGLRLRDIGLDDVWLIGPDQKIGHVSGFIQYPGMLIVESILHACPPDHTLIFDPHSSMHQNVLRLH